MISAAKMPARSATAMTERSIPPEIIDSPMASEKRANSGVCWSTETRLVTLKNAAPRRADIRSSTSANML
jgi:hypothetical protein